MIEINISKNEDLNLHECTMKVELPAITVVRHKADRSDFKYEMQRAVTEIVEQYIEKHMDDF